MTCRTVEPVVLKSFAMLLSVVCLLVFIILLWVYRRWDIYKMGIDLNSGLWALPFIGHLYMFIGNNNNFMIAHQRLGRDALRNENGVSSFWLGYKLYALVADPVIAEFVLKTTLEKDDIMDFLKPHVGNGSLIAPVSIWRPRRKVMIPTFSSKNIKYFVLIFNKQSKILCQQLNKVAGTGTISIWKNLTAYTMDSIAEATLGYEMHAQNDSKHPFLEYFEEALRLVSARMMKLWLYNDLIYSKTNECKGLMLKKESTWAFIKELIVSKRKEILEKEHEKHDHFKPEAGYKSFMELLIRNSGGEEGYTDLEITEELMVLLIAGNDTSAVASSFICLMLARHPEVQAKVFEELQNVFGDSNKSVTIEDLLRLKYLDAVIRETIRLYTPVPIITRKVDKEFYLPCNIKMVPGTGIAIYIWAIHRNTRYWGDDAEQFRPERFIDTPLKHPAAFMPFSFGPRNCIGYQFAMMSIKIAISTILRHFKILPPNNLPSSLQPPLRLEYNLMMKDTDNYQIRLERRINKSFDI